MSHKLNFLSIMTGAASSGSFSVTVQSIDAQSNCLQTMVVTGIVAGQSPISIANASLTQLNIQLIQYGLNYSGSPQFTSNMTINTLGQPVFSSQLGLATFRITVSEHILCFFSEADFLLTATDIGTGTDYYCSETPLLMTVATAKTSGPIVGLVLEDVSGTTLTNSQIETLVEMASARLIAILNNRIVICTFVHEDSGYWQRSFFLRDGLPGIYYDGVRVKRPYSVSLFGTLIGDSTSVVWNYVRPTGELNYIPSQNLVNTFEPSAIGNEIKISYVAGNYRIPIAIVQGVLQYMVFVLENKADISELADGTWRVKFKDTPIINRLRDELTNWIIF